MPGEPLPEVARRRGNADTLFSADWFDDDEGKATTEGSTPAPAEKARPAAPVKPATPIAAAPSFADDDDDLVPARSGGRTMLIVGAIGFLLLMMCGGISAGLAIVWAIRG